MWKRRRRRDLKGLAQSKIYPDSSMYALLVFFYNPHRVAERQNDEKEDGSLMSTE